MQRTSKIIQVLHIIDNINIDSGVSSVVMNLYRHIDRELIQFDFLVCRRGIERGVTYDEEIHSLGGDVFYFGSPLSIRGLVKSTYNVKKYFKHNANNYNIVHLHSPTIAEFTLKYAKHYGINTIIVHSHSSMTSQNRLKAFVNTFLISRIKKYANYRWACSNEAAEFLYGKNFCSSNEIVLLKNAIDPDIFQFDANQRKILRTKLNLNNKRVFVHISNFSSIKNIMFLIPVIRKTTAHDSNIRYLFVGNGPTKNIFQQGLKQNKLNKYCLFTGVTEEVHKYLSASDAMVLPSIKEGLPVTTIEAQANGLKCFISNTITHECDVGNVDFIELSADKWIEKINSFVPSTNEVREQHSQEFRNSLFNIAKEANHLKELYLALIN